MLFDVATGSDLVKAEWIADRHVLKVLCPTR